MPGPATTAALRDRLLAWYDAGHRDLPWRRDLEPYHIWIAEVMLQQTRAATVEPHYLRWIQRFPDVPALAAATLDDVLEAWHGLGYYARARNLHRAARAVMAERGGQLPRTFEDWRSLPGVGAYTAGAVASIAFGQRTAAVDGNVRRVLARIEAEMEDVARQPAAGRIAGLAADLADCARPGDVNQALMELGALVCTPQRPACSACPARGTCRAEAAGCPTCLPSRAQARLRPMVAAAAVVARGPRGPVLIARRSGHGHLAGLWEFPLAAVGSSGSAEAAARSLLEALGLAPRRLREAAPVRHDFTHVRWRITPVVVVLRRTSGSARMAIPLAARAVAEYDEWSWTQPADLALRPTSRLMDKIVAAAWSGL